MSEVQAARAGAEACATPSRVMGMVPWQGWVFYDLATRSSSLGVISVSFRMGAPASWRSAQRHDYYLRHITASSMCADLLCVSPVLGASKRTRPPPYAVPYSNTCGRRYSRQCSTQRLCNRDLASGARQHRVPSRAQFDDAHAARVSTEGQNRGRSCIGVGIGYLGSDVAIASALHRPVKQAWGAMDLGCSSGFGLFA
jgi:hypothetical protein